MCLNLSLVDKGGNVDAIASIWCKAVCYSHKYNEK